MTATQIGVLAASLVGGFGVSPVLAVGMDGPGNATGRLSLVVGAGFDRVGGYGQDTYPFVETAVAGEAMAWKRLVVGAALTVRKDLQDYNDALGRWRGERSAGVAAQMFLGYETQGLHVSVGPWLYGSGRARKNFRAAVLPYGVLRIRVGQLGSWHYNLRVADGVPFTAGGGAFGLRLMAGAPAWGRHRPSGGLYTSIGEKTLGLVVCDEVQGAGIGSALSWGVLVGTDTNRLGSRPEIAAFVGVVW